MRNNTMTVQELKTQGNEVEVKHERVYRNINELTSDVIQEDRLMSRGDFAQLPVEEQANYELRNEGGLTTIEITDGDGITLTGQAQCSDLDMFNRKRGLTIAIGRALSTRNKN